MPPAQHMTSSFIKDGPAHYSKVDDHYTIKNGDNEKLRKSLLRSSVESYGSLRRLNSDEVMAVIEVEKTDS